MNTTVTNLDHCLKVSRQETAPFQQVTVTTTASTLADLGVTLDELRTKVVEITFEGVVRYTDQAATSPVAPTAAIGHYTAAGDRRLFDVARAKNLKFYGSSVKINVTKLTI